MKKPFYKRWWFIAFAVLLVLGAIGSMGEESATDESNEPANVEAEKSQEETPKETAEEKAAREAKEVEEKVVAEQKAKLEAEAKAKAKVDQVVPEKEEESIVAEVPAWQTEIETLAGNSDGASDKFYAIEKFMMDYESKATSEEVDSFKENILKAYQDKTYLNNPTDHKIMLTQIFQSYIVERHESKEWKDFAFDFHQNVKYVYRGVDTPDSDAVKANEAQMDKVINNLQ